MTTFANALTHIFAWCQANPDAEHLLSRKHMAKMNHSLESLKVLCEKNGIECSLEETKNGTEPRIVLKKR